MIHSFTVCYKTEVIKNTLNPNWKMIEVPVRTICNGDYDRTVKVEVYDWDRDGGLVKACTSVTSVQNELMHNCRPVTFRISQFFAK